MSHALLTKGPWQPKRQAGGGHCHITPSAKQPAWYQLRCEDRQMLQLSMQAEREHVTRKLAVSASMQGSQVLCCGLN